jgi:uncharacterized protein (DUF1800 family)
VNRFKLLLLSCTLLSLAGCASVVSDGTGGPSSFALTVTPASISILGDTTQQFSAKASDGSNPTLTWSVNGVAGGSATTGTISAAGLFTAPEFPPTPNAVTITAAETNHTSKSGSSAVTLQNPVPQLDTASPMAIPVGAFTLTLTGAHFAQGAIVNFGSGALTTTYISSTQLTASGTATTAQIGNVTITVVNPNPGNGVSKGIVAQVKGPSSLVTVSPGTGNVRTGGTQLFVATVTGMANTGVSWSVNGVPGGNDTVGTVIGNGNYSAPMTLPSPNNITVTATSIADTTQSGNSAITLQNAVAVLTTVSPTAVTAGPISLTLTGTGFVNGAVVNFGSTALATTFVSATELTAKGTAIASQAGNVPVTVTNPNPGATASNAINVLVSVPNPNIKVTVAPGSLTLVTDGTQLFTATVVGTTNTAVTWSVNGETGGDSTIGTIDINGNYNAPDNLPSPNSVTVTATSVADPTKSGSAIVTFLNPVPVLTSITPGTIGLGPFQISLNGTGFVNTSTISVSYAGAAPTLTYASPMLMSAVGNIATASDFTVTVTNPAPGGGTSGSVTVHVTTSGTPVSSAAAVRFLEQASFGPDTETVDQLQETGFDQYLQNQFNAANSAYKDPTTTTQIYDLQRIWFLHAIAGGDQLRQRSSLALNELWVVAADKVNNPLGYTNYLRTLNQDALGNYLNIMKDVTLSPAMGDYLDMVNNDKPAPGQHANENYAREIMQLFTLGLNQLNPDGSPVLDTSGNPVPTYTQNDVMALGLVFTGWTYPTQPGMSPQRDNPPYYGGPMIAVESNHDMTAKTFLGQSIPAGQTAEADMNSALGIIFNHPNIGPFVARQLILRLVTSNPSSLYIQDVATAFNSGSFTSGGITYGSATRGDMQAVLAAILLDPEARRGDSPTTAVATDGKLREPIVMEVSIARAFHALTDAAGFSNEGDNMEQNVFYPATVFNFFPPVSPIQGSTLNGPEFAIFDTTSSLERVNFINDATYGAIGSYTHLDFTPVVNSGPGGAVGTPDQMITWLYNLFLHSSTQDSMYSTILTAVNAVDPANTKAQAQAAIYLVTSSSMYQVQH